MKVVLTTLNAKYIHSNLAIRCLKSYAEQKLPVLLTKELECLGNRTFQPKALLPEIELAEYTINQPFDQILQDLYQKKPEFIGFSCYLWNISLIKELVQEYKKLDPQVLLWLGGPEVSFEPLDYLNTLPQLEGIIIGEGEETFTRLLEYYCKRKEFPHITLSEIEGIAFREREVMQNHKFPKEEHNGELMTTKKRTSLPFENLPFPYQAEEEKRLSEQEHKIIYYESARGCPFSCSYCLSSLDKKVRFRDWNRIASELKFFLDQKVPQVKFVDRTFNCRKEHTIKIWRFLQENDNGITNFHFEVTAELLDQEEIELLNSMRPGLVQLEIGVQSLNPDTLAAIGRTMDLEKLQKVTKQIRQGGKVHQHLDLIAGLPMEDYTSFRQSFNGVYAMEPDQLQLGFLKVLKGAPISQRAKEFGIVSQSRAPYEVLYTKWISYQELIWLKQVEELLELYYNSGQFSSTMRYLLHFFEDAFSMYEALAKFYVSHGYKNKQQTRRVYYEILIQFSREWENEHPMNPLHLDLLKELLTYDYCLREEPKSKLAFAADTAPYREQIRKAAEKVRKDGEIQGQFHLEWFHFSPEESAKQGIAVKAPGILLFSYKDRNPLTKNAMVKRIL